MKIEINPENRRIAFLAIFTTVIFAIGLAVAYSDPPTGITPASEVGHSADELNLDPLHIDWVNERIGIGTESPGEELEVNGNIKLSGATPTYKLTNLATPVAGSDAVTKDYADALAGETAYSRKCSWNFVRKESMEAEDYEGDEDCGGTGWSEPSCPVWPYGLDTSCTPPDCAEGHADIGIDCYATSFEAYKFCFEGGCPNDNEFYPWNPTYERLAYTPKSYTVLGVCERVCIG